MNKGYTCEVKGSQECPLGKLGPSVVDLEKEKVVRGKSMTEWRVIGGPVGKGGGQ